MCFSIDVVLIFNLGPVFDLIEIVKHSSNGTKKKFASLPT